MREPATAVYAGCDTEFVAEMIAFLECGCDVQFDGAGAIAEGGFFEAWGRANGSAFVLLVLSPGSSPEVWPLRQWETLMDEAECSAVVMVKECKVPGRLRKGAFFDVTRGKMDALRLLKRWVWIQTRERGKPVSGTVSRELDWVYAAVADRPGRATVSGDAGARFWEEAGESFDAAFWIPAHRRSLARISGDLGMALGMTLSGPVSENLETMRRLLPARRCLVVLDGADAETADALWVEGRTSFLLTDGPVRIQRDRCDLREAQRFVDKNRLAEAYELLAELMRSGIEPPYCARKLAWTCDEWGWHDEAGRLRKQFSLAPTKQLELF